MEKLKDLEAGTATIKVGKDLYMVHGGGDIWYGVYTMKQVIEKIAQMKEVSDAKGK